MTKSGGWGAIRDAVRQRLGASTFDTWFRVVEGNLEGDTVTLSCPDRFSRDWIRSRYGEVLAEVAGAGRKLRYEVGEGSAAPAVARRESARTPSAAERPVDPDFDGFVIGPGNVLALEAARAIASGKAGHCSPLLIAGGSGLGKTHLCRAIRRELGHGVVYRSSDEFTSEVTSAMRSGRMDQFRARYRRTLNVLILEDVQFLAGRRATQVELFHTLDHLTSHGKAIVMSAERPPQEIEDLDPKLASRMSSGLVARISPPELDTRRSILREKAASGGVRIPDECLEILATRPVQSVRDLLSGLNQVIARAALLRRVVSPELVAEALSAFGVPGGASLDEIVELTARAYGLTLPELRGRSRRRRLVRPRQIAMYLARRYTEASLKEIGGSFGRDHSTVSYAIESVEKRVAERPQLRYELEALVARISPLTPSRNAGGSTPRTPRT